MNKTHIPAFDGLRAVAVGLVLLHHAGVPGFSEGGLGVDMFFVLSGYLITGLLTREIDQTGTVDLVRFYLRRLKRLTPALLILAVAYFTFAPAVWHERTASQHARFALAAVSYLTDFLRAGHPSFASPIAHTWSLAVEEHFYMLWPLALLGLSYLPKRLLLPVLLAGFALATVWRWSGSIFTAGTQLIFDSIFGSPGSCSARRSAWPPAQERPFAVSRVLLFMRARSRRLS